MARTVAQIQTQMLAEKAAQTALDGLTSTSQTAIWRLFIYIQAVSINVFEQLQDLFKTEIEGIVENNYVGSPKWVSTQCFKFQYSATTPQILQLNTTETKLAYPIIDETLQIITRASVNVDLNKNVNIKVAKSEPPIQLSAPEETAINGYLLEMMPAGVTYTVINAVSDKLYIAGTIYYNGQYASTIDVDVPAAINAYLSTIPFDGTLRIVELEQSIKAATGVIDLNLADVWVRANSTPIANATKLIDAETLKIISTTFNAGYAIEENTATYTWTDKIIYEII